MSESVNNAVLEVAAQVRGLLRFQQELGLEGLEESPPLVLRKAPAQPSQKASAPEKVFEGKAQDSCAPASVQSVVSGAAGLAQISANIGDCTRCKLSKGRTHIVFGVGNPEARLMFVGEGPGRDEDLQAEPFVGQAGKLLDRMIAAMGLRRSEVYIANIVKCRPPRNRDPEADEIGQCEPFLRQQIQAVQPEVIVGLGRFAVQTLLQDATPITRQRGKWRQYEGIAFMPTYHPAYLLRNPAEKRPVWQDLQAVMRRLGLEPASRTKNR